jgi:phosphopantetheinyl transferase (holo-ACP synthase)
MTGGNDLSDEVLDFYRQLSGLDISGVDLKRLSSAKRARFISFCRSKGIDPSVYQGGDTPVTKDNSVTGQSDKVVEFNISGGIGLDMVAVDELFPTEVEDLKGDPSVTGIFDLREIAYAETRPNVYETLAGIFAAKEAIVKTGHLDSYREKNFEKLVVEYDVSGMPHAQGFSLSITHCSGFAAAVAIPSRQPVQGNNDEAAEDYRLDNQAERRVLQPELSDQSIKGQDFVRPLSVILFLAVLCCVAYAVFSL